MHATANQQATATAVATMDSRLRAAEDNQNLIRQQNIDFMNRVRRIQEIAGIQDSQVTPLPPPQEAAGPPEAPGHSVRSAPY